MKGVANYAREHDWQLNCRMHWTHLPPKIGDWEGDGIITFIGVSDFLRKASQPLIEFIQSVNVPVVETQAYASYFGAPKVTIPHEAIGRTAAKHFLDLGFKNCGYVTFDENPLEQNKRKAFAQYVEAQGARFHALTPESLLNKVHKLPKPMALFAMNDANAIEVMQICQRSGYMVPEDYAVLGVDDTEVVCDFAPVPLSSVNCNLEKLGYLAAETLDLLMNGHPAPSQEQYIAPLGITVRRSTDTIAIADPDTAKFLRKLRDSFRTCQNLEQTADELGVSIRQVNKHFKAEVGHTPLQELTRLRIEYSKTLLNNPKNKIETVAIESGFSSRFHYISAFKRMSGTTPREFRISPRGKEKN